MSKSMKPSAVLERALKLLGPKGAEWAHGHDALLAGMHCAVTAIAWSCDDRFGDESAAARHAFSSSIGVEDGHIGPWNDAEGRTFEQVRAAFRKAIALAKKAEAA